MTTRRKSNRKNTRLREFARYGGDGRIVPGSNILAREKPKTGNWIEGQVSICCTDTITILIPT